MNYKYIIKKIIGYILIVLFIITLNFFLIRLMPGDVLIHLVGEEDYYMLLRDHPEILDKVAHSYGLDQPTYVQYFKYLGNVLQGDFGISYHYNKPVLEVILFRLKWTLYLVIPAIVISAFLGAAIGKRAGWKPGEKLDKTMTPLFLVLHTIPSYCISMILLVIFTYNLGVFPVGGMTSGGLEGLDKFIDILWHMTLPLLIIIIYRTSYNYLIMRNSVMGIKNEEYIITALSKGLSDRKILSKHVTKNAILPYVTIVCLQFGYAVSGTMTMEIIFSWKGMGTLIYDAVMGKDFPILQTAFLILTICVIIANLIADILYSIIDPRVKEGQVDA